MVREFGGWDGGTTEMGKGNVNCKGYAAGSQQSLVTLCAHNPLLSLSIFQKGWGNPMHGEKLVGRR